MLSSQTLAHPDRYLLFIEYFNAGKFMSAQTTLDEVWIKEDGHDRNFYAGLIQLAVALYHLTNDNPRGAQKIYEKATDLLRPYGAAHRDLQLASLLEKLDHLFLREVDGDKGNLDYMRLLPQIEFTGA